MTKSLVVRPLFLAVGVGGDGRDHVRHVVRGGVAPRRDDAWRHVRGPRGVRAPRGGGGDRPQGPPVKDCMPPTRVAGTPTTSETNKC